MADTKMPPEEERIDAATANRMAQELDRAAGSDVPPSSGGMPEGRRPEDSDEEALAPAAPVQSDAAPSRAVYPPDVADTNTIGGSPEEQIAVERERHP